MIYGFVIAVYALLWAMSYRFFENFGYLKDWFYCKVCTVGFVCVC